MLYGRGDPGGTFNVVTKQPLAEPTVTLGNQLNDQGMTRHIGCFDWMKKAGWPIA